MSVDSANLLKVQVGMLFKDSLAIRCKNQGLVRALLSKSRNSRPEDVWLDCPYWRWDVLISFKGSIDEETSVDAEAGLDGGDQWTMLGWAWKVLVFRVRCRLDNGTAHTLNIRLGHKCPGVSKPGGNHKLINDQIRRMVDEYAYLIRWMIAGHVAGVTDWAHWFK